MIGATRVTMSNQGTPGADGFVIAKPLLNEVLVLLSQVDVYFYGTDAPMGETARELIQKILSSTDSEAKR